MVAAALHFARNFTTYNSGLCQHRTVAHAVHLIGEALEQPALDASVPSFPREQIRLFAGGRRMEVKIVVGLKSHVADWARGSGPDAA